MLLLLTALVAACATSEYERELRPISDEAASVGAEQLVFFDALVEAAREHHRDCDGMAVAMRTVIDAHADSIRASSAHLDDLIEHFGDSASARLRQALPFINACSDNEAVVAVLASLVSTGQRR